jgi:hydrogenase-4 membrane subunit HyfE
MRKNRDQVRVAFGFIIAGTEKLVYRALLVRIVLFGNVREWPNKLARKTLLVRCKLIST